MTILRITAVTLLLACVAQAVVVKDFKRREAFDTYGPPPQHRPQPQYGPPPPQQQQHLPHREYGVPQQIPFREYGPPSIKYGPPKLNFLGGGSSSSNSFSSGLHEQIKTHFGVPKPFYGPPHISHKPAGSYGPPPPQQQYGPPPKQNYGPPPPLPQPQAQYGPPPQHRPAPNYGPPPQVPRPSYGPPPPVPQPLPSHGPAPLFKPPHHPATSYGPPASGPIGLPPKPVYGPPKQQYGPPQLPQLQGPRPSFNKVPETTIILTGSGVSGVSHGGHQGGPVKQVQIQIDSHGHTHSVSGSQAPFHTACDGWKPIPAPAGSYVENNNIETQGGYSHVSQAQSQLHTNSISSSSSGSLNFGTQYNGGSSDISSSGGSIIDGLTDEQLVAVALQSGSFDSPVNSIQEQGLPATGPATIQEFKQHGLNSVEAEALQLSLGSIDDSYNKPPADSYAPGSVHAQKFQGGGSQTTGFALQPPSGNYGPPPPPPQQLQQQHHHHHHHHHNSAAAFVHQHQAAAQAGLGIHYGSQSGNVHSFPPPPQGGSQPNKPVAYRPPVPQGLLESIGATVQHLDQFGVKPQQQPPTYIPPATNEFPETGPGNLGPEYGPPPPQQQQLQQQGGRQQLHTTTIIEQQLPQPQPPQLFVQQGIQIQQQHHQHQQHQEQQHRNEFSQYGPPPPPLPPQQQQQQFIQPPPPAPPSVQYLPPNQQNVIDFNSQAYENAISHSQYNHQYQQLPLQQQQQQQEPRFHHDCGHGPNLVGSSYQFQQQQQQLQQQQFSSSSSNSFNAISQSIPVAEQHTQFISVPTDSYGPPASGNDIDHIGYASQKNEVSALPDGTDPQNLPGLDGLNVISAQKSQSIQLPSEHSTSTNQQTTFELQFGGAAASPLNAEQTADHEEILSQGLLQSILTAIEQPQAKKQQPQPQQQQQAPNHLYSAQSRSDIDVHEDGTAEDPIDELSVADSTKIEVKVKANADDDTEEPATVTEIKPIVAAEVDEVDDE